MKKVVLDTNIIISALLSPEGNPANILTLVTSGEEIQLFYSAKILDEYRRVLSYPRLNIADEKKFRTIWLIENFGTLVEPPTSSMQMPDESDRVFYDTAHASGSVLITGNTRHYPTEDFIITPAQFIKILNDEEAAPNAETIKAIEEVQEMKRNPHKNKGFNNVETLFEDLNSDD